MPANHEFDELLLIASDADERAAWQEFGRYCVLRATGVRKPALQALDRFLQQATGWPFVERLAFVRWLMAGTARFPRYSSLSSQSALLIPQPLRDRLLIPTITEWSEQAPQDHEPFLWLGLLGHGHARDQFARALALDPACEKARRMLVDWMLDPINYNQHELPSFYIHDPREDLEDLQEALHIATSSSDAAWLDGTRATIHRYRLRAEAWLVLHPAPGDFALY